MGRGRWPRVMREAGELCRRAGEVGHRAGEVYCRVGRWAVACDALVLGLGQLVLPCVIQIDSVPAKLAIMRFLLSPIRCCLRSACTLLFLVLISCTGCNYCCCCFFFLLSRFNQVLGQYVPHPDGVLVRYLPHLQPCNLLLLLPHLHVYHYIMQHAACIDCFKRWT